MASADTPLLWHIEISHYNEKARWALDFKGIPHRRRAPQPGLHPLKSRQIGGAGTLPILEIDGRKLTDSTDIVAALEERQPDPPLYPADPADRARALELEDLCDVSLAPEVRRLFFFHVLAGGPDAVNAVIPPPNAVMGAFAKVGFPVLKAGMGRLYGIDRKRAEAAPAEIRAVWDELEAQRAGRPYLVGDSFTIADLTAAAISHPVVRPEQFEYSYGATPASLVPIHEALLEHPIVPWIRELYAKHRSPSAEIKPSAAAA